MEGALQVDVDDGVEVVVGHAGGQAVAGDAGVVHEHVHPPVGLGRSGDERVGLLFYGHVGGHGQGFHAELFGDLGGYRLGGGQAALRRAVHHHVHAGGRQLAGHGASDAAGGAGHHGAAAVL